MLLSTIVERLTKPATIAGLALAVLAMALLACARPLVKKLFKPETREEEENAVMRVKMIVMFLAFAAAALVVFTRP